MLTCTINPYRMKYTYIKPDRVEHVRVNKQSCKENKGTEIYYFSVDRQMDASMMRLELLCTAKYNDVGLHIC